MCFSFFHPIPGRPPHPEARRADRPGREGRTTTEWEGGRRRSEPPSHRKVEGIYFDVISFIQTRHLKETAEWRWRVAAPTTRRGKKPIHPKEVKESQSNVQPSCLVRKAHTCHLGRGGWTVVCLHPSVSVSTSLSAPVSCVCVCVLVCVGARALLPVFVSLLACPPDLFSDHFAPRIGAKQRRSSTSLVLQCQAVKSGHAASPRGSPFGASAERATGADVRTSHTTEKDEKVPQTRQCGCGRENKEECGVPRVRIRDHYHKSVFQVHHSMNKNQKTCNL